MKLVFLNLNFSSLFCVGVKYFTFFPVSHIVRLAFSDVGLKHAYVHEATNEHLIESLCFIIDTVADRKGRNNCFIPRVYLEVFRLCFINCLHFVFADFAQNFATPSIWYACYFQSPPIHTAFCILCFRSIDDNWRIALVHKVMNVNY